MHLSYNKPFLQVMASGILGSTQAMLVSCSGYLVLWYYANGSEAKTIFYYLVFGGGYFIGNLAAMYLTPAFLKFYSKKDLYNWSQLLSAIPFMTVFGLYLLKLDYIPLVAIFIFGAGILQGFPAVLQSSMIADSVDYLEWRIGEKADGLCFAGQTFLAKLKSAVAYYGALMVLSLVNYNPEAMQNYVTAGGIARLQFPEVMTALFVIITVLPALGSVLAVIPTWRYCLTEQEHERILNVLIEKRRRQGLAAAKNSSLLLALK